MGEILKRFRFSLYCLLVIVIYSLVVPAEEFSGWFSALMLFVLFPAAVVLFVWALYRAIKDVVLYFQGEPWPEKTTPVEIRIVVGIYDFISGEIDYIRSSGKAMKARYFILTFGGIGLAVAGLAIIIFGFFSYVLIAVGTVVLIVGIAMVKLASPGRFNTVSDDFALIDNKGGYTVDGLYEFLTAVQPDIGVPDKIIITNSNTEGLAWKAADDRVIIVYPTAHGEGLYVYNAPSFTVKEYLTQNENSGSLENTDDLFEEVKELLETGLDSEEL